MLFNSLDFAVFLPIIFIIYWALNDKKLIYQNITLLIGSYIFYGWWDWRFLFLILFSTLVDYLIGINIKKTDNKKLKKTLLWTSITVNIGLLGFFKYYNFFLENFIDAFSFFGHTINANSLNIILPIGISFYTFQTLSYTIDIYRNKIEPTKDFISFASFVSFFPQLVAGPIERASNLLPQFYVKRKFENNKAVDGLRQILWGLFKKMVIADNAAIFANMIFNNSDDYSGSTLFLGALFFTFQIYGDFSGYSDIAIGTSRLFGFNLSKNFAFPYFSRDIAEFWRRWHISLSTWFRDYLYIPLGGSRGSVLKKIRNIFIIFIVSGFWHGANWTFVVWGALNALYFLPLLLLNKNRSNIDIVAKGKIFPSIIDFFKITLTFILTVFTWIFFRAENIKHAISYIYNIFSEELFKAPDFIDFYKLIYIYVLIIFFVIIEWFGRNSEYALEKLAISRARPIRWILYSLIIFCIGMFMITDETPFIYFQF